MTYWITRISNADETAPNITYLMNQHAAATAEELGFEVIDYIDFPNILNYPERREKIISALTGVVQEGDLVVVQFPLWIQPNFQAEFIDQIRKKKNVKLVALVHAVIPWMYDKAYEADKDFFLSMLRKFDLLLTANEAMSRRLKEDKVEVSSLPMRAWDFRYHGPVREKVFRKQLNFLDSTGLKTLDYQAVTPLKIYGQGEENEEIMHLGSVDFQKVVDLSELPYHLNSGFGVVNARNFKDVTSYDYERYYAYTNSKRLSVYLSAGLPVIVPSDSAQAELVKSRNLGLVLDDLNEVDQLMRHLTEEDYFAMVEAVKPWQEAISTGFFIKRALLNAIRILELGFYDQVFEESGFTIEQQNEGKYDELDK